MTETSTTKTAALVARADRASRLRRRHRDYFEALAEEAGRQPRGPDRMAWLESLDDEYDNLRLALEWSLEEQDGDASLRLAVAMHDVWAWRGDASPAGEWVSSALAIAPDEPSALRAAAMFTAS